MPNDPNIPEVPFDDATPWGTMLHEFSVADLEVVRDRVRRTEEAAPIGPRREGLAQMRRDVDDAIARKTP